jgi:hypothetical protein
VKDNWDSLTTVAGQQKTLAYALGYNADINIPSSYGSLNTNIIILGFGRQAILSSTVAGYIDWGVNLPGSTQGLHSNAWVKARAEEFIQGYSDNHTVTAAIVIGTANDNGSWTCDEANGTISGLWNLSGTVWRSLAESIIAQPRVEKWAGNDIEAWNNEFPNGVACGKGTVSWYDGFLTTAPNRPHLNFGSNAFIENTAYWTPYELYQVSYAKPNAVIAPQIYCSGQIDQWVNFRRYYNVMYRGVTSTNGFGSCSLTTPMYTWSDAWNEFNNGLIESSSSDPQPSQYSTPPIYN